jgi:hypothetical protein
VVHPALICRDRVPLHFSQTVSEKISEEVLPRIPEDRWKDVDRPLPLRFDTSIDAVVLEALRHCTGSFRDFAVYVLECRHTTEWGQHAAVELGKVKQQRWRGDLDGARRVIYVGMTVNLSRRLLEHVQEDNDEGAEFTQIFPPLRVLDVSWYRNRRRVARAEKMLADAIDERFPGDYVMQS